MISVVCVYNNKDTLNDNLLKSLKGQTLSPELILLDNTGSKFLSAAAALNYGGAKATGKYIMFVHQDVNLFSNTWLDDAEKLLDTIPDLGIAGVAGMIGGKAEGNAKRGRNVIKHGEPSRDWALGNPITQPAVVQTMDECLTIVPKSVFSQLKFDEETCDHWHLYAVDYCLSVPKLGLTAYAIPMSIYHHSRGIFGEGKRSDPSAKAYYRNLKDLLKKHRESYKRIYTTNGEWNTAYPVSMQRLAKLIIYVWPRMRRWHASS